MALPAIMFLSSGMIVGSFLAGCFLISGVAFASLVVSAGFGFWLYGPSRVPRRHSHSQYEE